MKDEADCGKSDVDVERRLAEIAVLAELLPPLNVAKVATPWRPLVRAGRRRLAAQAEAWGTGQNAPT